MADEWVYTGVSATEEQEKRLRRPSISNGLFGFAVRQPSRHEEIHACALERGLPQIVGFYGYDFGRHEFIRMAHQAQGGMLAASVRAAGFALIVLSEELQDNPNLELSGIIEAAESMAGQIATLIRLLKERS